LSAPPGQPPLEALPPDAPATVEDVRASRRWTWVALAWAIAASAIAVIALVNNSNDNSGGSTTQTQSTADLQAQVKKLQEDTNARLDAFSRRLNDKAAKSDVDKLDKRLATVEDDLNQAQDDVSKQSAAIQQLQSDVKDLQRRVDDLESQQGQGGTTTTP
jgi:chromosome segregation ATPase